MHDFLARWARLAPDRVAIDEVDAARAHTYGRLDDRAARLAVALRDGLGLPEGARVAMLCGARVEVLEALFACARAGLTLVPLNTRLALPELAGVLADARPAVLVHDAAHADAAAALLAQAAVPRALGLDGRPAGPGLAWDDALAAAAPRRLRSVGLEDLPLALYTSGTTGAPKGVLIPWRQVVFNAVNTALACALTPADRGLACLPLFHTGGLHCLATPLLHRGGSVALTAGFDPEQAVRLLASGEVTTTIAVPVMYQALLDAGLAARGAPAVRSLLCGGAPCPLPLIDAFHDAGLPLRQGYGLTEVGPNCFTLAPLEGPHRLGSVGWPAFHSEARLVDDAGREVGPDTPGELLLRGPHVTAGYLGRPDETARVLDPEGWLHTGDVLRRSEDGAYYVVGRKKDLFISGGENVYPGEVEAALAGHPAVAQVAVVAVPDPRWGQVGLAALVLAPGAAAPTPDALRAWARERLAGYKVPRHWRVVDALPATSSGKVQRPAVLALLEARGELP